MRAWVARRDRSNRAGNINPASATIFPVAPILVLDTSLPSVSRLKRALESIRVNSPVTDFPSADRVLSYLDQFGRAVAPPEPCPAALLVNLQTVRGEVFRVLEQLRGHRQLGRVRTCFFNCADQPAIQFRAQAYGVSAYFEGFPAAFRLKALLGRKR